VAAGTGEVEGLAVFVAVIVVESGSACEQSVISGRGGGRCLLVVLRKEGYVVKG
jgi:hypothetical protein